MDRTSVLVLTAVFLLGAFALVPRLSEAQVSNSLEVDACSRDTNVQYIQAPQPGDAAGCGIMLGGVQLHLTKSGVGGTGALAVDKTGVTNGNGTYLFSGPDIVAGTYTLALKRVGYSDLDFQINIQGNVVRRVGLVPESVTVNGTVKDARGNGLAKAHVTACCGPDVGQQDAYADAAGAFSVLTQSGERTFSVDRDGMQLASLTQFVDGTQTLALVVPDAPKQDATLRGTVTDQDGKTIAGVTINVYSYAYQTYPQPYGAATTSAPAQSGSSGSGVASPAMRPCCPYYNGNNQTTTDAAGRYSIHVFGGSSVSMSVYLEGYANYYQSVQVETGSVQHDIQLLKFPPKTAHIEGKVVDASTGKALRYVSISAQSPAYGLYECSQDPSASSPEGTVQPADGGDVKGAMPYPGGGSDNGCAIHINDDGTFLGNVTPGYTILTAYYESYRACPASSDGSYQPCSPEYYSWSQSIRLAADHTTTISVRMEQRPAPDAVVSGYLIDAKNGTAIPKGQVSFSSEDGYGYGYATTDADGSYRIKIRSGHLDVYASAEGHLHWVGMMTIKAGETPFDINLEPGQESNGGCCIAYAQGGGKMMAADSAAPAAMGAPTGSSTQSAQSGAGGTSNGAASAFEDLHGGLGPYDAASRSKAVAASTGHASPGAGLLVLVGLLAGTALMRRRVA